MRTAWASRLGSEDSAGKSSKEFVQLMKSSELEVRKFFNSVNFLFVL